MRQIVPRTLHRRLRRVELWNGNIEPPLWTILTRRDHILRWAWRTRPKTPAPVGVVASDDPLAVVGCATAARSTPGLTAPSRLAASR